MPLFDLFLLGGLHCFLLCFFRFLRLHFHYLSNLLPDFFFSCRIYSQSLRSLNLHHLHNFFLFLLLYLIYSSFNLRHFFQFAIKFISLLRILENKVLWLLLPLHNGLLRAIKIANLFRIVKILVHILRGRELRPEVRVHLIVVGSLGTGMHIGLRRRGHKLWR